MRSSLRQILTLLLCSALAGCATNHHAATTGLAGHLVIIGGGLDDDNKPVYERFVALATPSVGEPAHILIATAASGDQDSAAKGKTESLRAYAPSARIDVLRRETSAAEGVALIDASTAMFFTGGDQKRITDRYRAAGNDSPETTAMRRLLARNGVIAGTSAGDAMMSDPMFLTGRSAEALGIHSTRTGKSADDDPDDKAKAPVLGPQIGTGMGFLPWAITDSHFFERNRFGRLVAALEASHSRLGLGVGEDAAVEVNLSTGELIGLSVADALLVDAGSLRRDGFSREGIHTIIIGRGTRVSLTRLLERPAGPAPAAPTSPVHEVPIVEPGQNRQLASWRFFTSAQTPPSGPTLLHLDGYDLAGWPDGSGGAIVKITAQQRP